MANKYECMVIISKDEYDDLKSSTNAAETQSESRDNTTTNIEVRNGGTVMIRSEGGEELQSVKGTGMRDPPNGIKRGQLSRRQLSRRHRNGGGGGGDMMRFQSFLPKNERKIQNERSSHSQSEEEMDVDLTESTSLYSKGEPMEVDDMEEPMDVDVTHQPSKSSAIPRHRQSSAQNPKAVYRVKKIPLFSDAQKVQSDHRDMKILPENKHYTQNRRGLQTDDEITSGRSLFPSLCRGNRSQMAKTVGMKRSRQSYSPTLAERKRPPVVNDQPPLDFEVREPKKAKWEDAKVMENPRLIPKEGESRKRTLDFERDEDTQLPLKSSKMDISEDSYDMW